MRRRGSGFTKEYYNRVMVNTGSNGNWRRAKGEEIFYDYFYDAFPHLLFLLFFLLFLLFWLL